MNKKGFTLTEILVVIVVLSILAVISFIGYQRVRTQAKITKAQSDLVILQSATQTMAIDTRTWPYGSPRGRVVRACTGAGPDELADGIEQSLSANGATGLSTKPSVGSGDWPFTWTQQAVDAWKGPYVPPTFNFIDPWGHPYRIDPDYNPYIDCPGHPNYIDRMNQNTVGSPSYNPPDACDVGYFTDKYSRAAIVSAGPNGLSSSIGSPGTYDCDDIFFVL